MEQLSLGHEQPKENMISPKRSIIIIIIIGIIIIIIIINTFIIIIIIIRHHWSLILCVEPAFKQKHWICITS